MRVEIETWPSKGPRGHPSSLDPYAAGALFIDYMMEGHDQLIPKDTPALGPDNLIALKVPPPPAPNPESLPLEATDIGAISKARTNALATFKVTFSEIKAPRE